MFNDIKMLYCDIFGLKYLTNPILCDIIKIARHSVGKNYIMEDRECLQKLQQVFYGFLL